MLELVYITVLEAVAARIKGSTPFACTTTPVETGVILWLRSTEVVHFLGKEEVGGSIPPGASSVKRFNIALDVLLVTQAGVRKLPICLLSSTG